MRKRWYEREKPLTERAGPISVSWFPRANRLQLTSIRTEPENGRERLGLTFTIGVRDLRSNLAAVKLIERLLERARGT
jgi:hypothetical protein